MQLNTRHFGVIDVDDNNVISFCKGIPGFEKSTKYIVIEGDDEASPFKWLQSIDMPDLTLAIVDPFAIKEDYNFELNSDMTENLGINSYEDILIYSIIVVPEDISKISMNLKAPVVINSKSKRGEQIILDTDIYGVRHYILDELQG